MTTVKVKNEEETCHLAERLAPLLRTGDVVFLIGTLGAGKTAFARALIQSLCGKNIHVPSPTFTLVQHYETTSDQVIHHYDLYRIPDEAEDDIIELGWEESLETAIILIEWPLRLGYLIPENRLEIALEYGQNDEERNITLTALGTMKERNWNIPPQAENI